MDEQKQKRVVQWVTVAIVTVMFVLTVLLTIQFVKIHQLKTTEETLQNHLTELEQSILHYSSENNYLESSEFVEDYAREVLGYGLNGETRFR